MKNLKSENGVTLVTVLLMITIFTIIGITVTNLSISNTKQIAKTKQEMQAVDLAEMGVIYYKNVLIKQSNKVLKSKRDEAKTAIETKNTINKTKAGYTTIPINNETILAELNTILEHMEVEGTINTFLPPITLSTPIMVKENPDYNFQIESPKVQYDNTNHKIIIEFISIGSVQENQRTNVKSTIELNVKELVNATVINPSTGSDTTTDSVSSIISKPEDTVDCIYNGEFDTTKKCSYNTIKDTTNNDKKIENISALINGDLELSNTKKINIDNSFLYITNNATFGDFNGSISNLTLYVGGNATFSDISGGIKDNSTLLIVGDAIFGGKTTSEVKNSKVCVGRTISGRLTFKDDNVYDWKNNKDVCGEFVNTGSNPVEPTLLDLLPSIAEQAKDNMTLDYFE